MDPSSDDGPHGRPPDDDPHGHPAPDTEVAQARELAARRAAQQRVIADLAAAALAQLDLDVLFDKAVETTARHLDAPLCKVLELTPDRQRLFLRSGVGWADGLVGSASVPADAGSQGGFTLLQDRPVVVFDLRTETRFTGPPLLEDHGVISGISTIIRDRAGGAWGVLGVHTRVESAFDEDDIAFIDAAAGILSGAVARRAIEDELAGTVERLQVSEQVRGAFVNAVSHELRTPLQAIVGFAETLGSHDGRLDESQRRDCLARLVDSTHRLQAQIERVLEVGDLDRGLVTARRRAVDLAALIERVLAAFTADDVRFDLDLAPVTLDLDAGKIARVITAIVHNAVRASPPAGAVRVWLRGDHRGATIEVEDDGPGLDPRVRELLFDPFVQGEERTEAARPGLGVGLTLARGFVALHAGAIRAIEPPTGGLRVSIELPAGPA